jgi:NitT/TauT family transport system substrate-binding protein
VLKDEVDIGVSAEYTVVGEVFENEDISVIGCIDKYQSISILGRKDRGIENVSDLKGKKIGSTRRGIVEFYLGRFLDLQGMSMQDVTLVNLQSPQYVQAITNGSVDALITGAYIDQIQERLGNNVVLWSAQSSQPGYATLACRGSWASSHPEQINRFLKSLAQAEKYAINHPDDAKAILQKRLNYTDAYMAEIWPQHQFSLTLDQSLLLAMNDEGRWMIKNNLTA